MQNFPIDKETNLHVTYLSYHPLCCLRLPRVYSLCFFIDQWTHEFLTWYFPVNSTAATTSRGCRKSGSLWAARLNLVCVRKSGNRLFCKRLYKLPGCLTSCRRTLNLNLSRAFKLYLTLEFAFLLSIFPVSTSATCLQS